jgi:peptidoglycan hydrolase-like protein with peptidoglycan-binding domain
VERALATLGYDVGKPDGRLDQKTQIAITRFQMENGLQPGGEASVPLAAMLETKVAGNAPPAGAAAEQEAVEKPKCVPKSSQE